MTQSPCWGVQGQGWSHSWVSQGPLASPFLGQSSDFYVVVAIKKRITKTGRCSPGLGASNANSPKVP